MKKSQFLRRLGKELKPLGEPERRSALAYWAEYIDEASAQSGEAEAIAQIGAPEEVAVQILEEAGLRPAPHRRRSPAYWALFIMASPIWISLGAAGLCVAVSLALVLCLLILVPALVGIILSAAGLFVSVVSFAVLRDGATFSLMLGCGLASVGAGGLLLLYMFPLVPRAFGWLVRRIHFRKRVKI